MKRFADKLTASVPAYRVLDRDKNLDFFREVLGFKVLLEESSYCYLGGHEAKKKRLIIQESPRARAVLGKKKHAKTVILLEAAELENILAKNLESIDKVYKQGEHWAFEVTSPSADRFLLVSDKDLSSLVAVDKGEVQLEEKADFMGLSDFEVLEIQVRVADDRPKLAFEALCGSDWNQPKLSFSLDSGEDLTARPEEVHDLEFLLFEVDKSLDLAEIKAGLSPEIESSLDLSEKNLLVVLPDSIEVWLVKA